MEDQDEFLISQNLKNLDELEKAAKVSRMTKPTYIIGDVHGRFASLTSIVNRMQDCTLICVGDLGMGFHYNKSGEIAGLERLNLLYARRNVTFLSIRGNHDDPSYFDGSINFSHIKLLPDYTKLEINGEKWLLVGGAISIDRSIRNVGTSYWVDEPAVLREDLIEKCDVLVTHTGPMWIGPDFTAKIVQDYASQDATLIDDLKAERELMNKIYAKASPRAAYLGHFHVPEYASNGGCNAKILAELEVTEHRVEDKL